MYGTYSYLPFKVDFYAKSAGKYHMSNGVNLLHPQKDVAEMVIVFCVSLIVPEDLGVQ